MKEISLKNVKKSYHGELILEDFNLTIPAGKFFALLGPSGSGKTTILRLIAGFETVDKGSIYLGNQEITYTPINQRRINTVFQNYALFPHLNVFDNVAYSLNIRRLPKDVIEEKVIKILKTVHLEKHIYKNIQQLSGGQQQRVALARAIVNEPEVLLLDEPLAALDVKLRERMLVELIDLQEQLGTTFVYVTHDQLEALTVADRMAIMNYDGEIEQIASPKEIYEYPATSFVANFVGSTNIFKGSIVAEGATHLIVLKDLGSFIIMEEPNKPFVYNGNTVLLSVRPEKLLITKKKTEGFSNCLEGQVIDIIYHGQSTLYNIRLDNTQIVQVFDQNDQHVPQEIIAYDDRVQLYWQKENAVLLEK